MIIQNIVSIIEEKGTKRAVVAKRAGLKPQELYDILNNRKLLRIEHILPLSKALGVTPVELLGEMGTEDHANITLNVKLDSSEAELKAEKLVTLLNTASSLADELAEDLKGLKVDVES